MTYLLLIIAALAWGAFIVWTLYRLGSHRTQMGISYIWGVQRIGIGLWLASIILEVMGRQVLSQSQHQSLWRHALLVAFVTLPVCLWVGYVWARAVQELVPRGSRRRRKPPTLP